MSRFHSYLYTAENIIGLYKGEMPLSAFLKNYFSREKKYGSRDRKHITSLCYNFFRAGFATKNKTKEEALIISIFLCNQVSNEVLQAIKPDWNEKISFALDDKMKLAGIQPDMIFPFNEHLSHSIDVKAFSTSFLIQPKVFIRLRPGKKELVKKKLEKANLNFTEESNETFSVANGTKLEEVLQVNREAIIQDLNSQRVGEMLSLTRLCEHALVWDCCAASGGKSIMASDLVPGIQLTVSDVRQSIIQNLHKRFKEAGLHRYTSFVADLTNPASLSKVLTTAKFDLVICDVPCSGSGTWSRTPEQLFYFKQDELKRYSDLQKSIISNSISYVKTGGYFLYITCSVFLEENELAAAFIQQQFNVELVKTELLKGYKMKADTMFTALFRKIAGTVV